jgi:hypothetical protein
VQELYGHPSEVLARARIKQAYGTNVTELKWVAEKSG